MKLVNKITILNTNIVGYLHVATGWVNKITVLSETTFSKLNQRTYVHTPIDWLDLVNPAILADTVTTTVENIIEGVNESGIGIYGIVFGAEFELDFSDHTTKINEVELASGVVLVEYVEPEYDINSITITIPAEFYGLLTMLSNGKHTVPFMEGNNEVLAKDALTCSEYTLNAGATYTITGQLEHIVHFSLTGGFSEITGLEHLTNLEWVYLYNGGEAFNSPLEFTSDKLIYTNVSLEKWNQTAQLDQVFAKCKGVLIAVFSTYNTLKYDISNVPEGITHLKLDGNLYMTGNYSATFRKPQNTILLFLGDVDNEKIIEYTNKFVNNMVDGGAYNIFVGSDGMFDTSPFYDVVTANGWQGGEWI